MTENAYSVIKSVKRIQNEEAGKPANLERANRILDAAARLIVHYGFDKTTVDDISREAGISKGAVYLHWASKDDLFESLVWREAWDTIRDMMAAIDADPQGGTFMGMYKHGLLSLSRRPLMLALYNRDARILGDFLRRRDPSLMVKRNLLNQEFIQAMQKAGLIRPEVNATTLAFLSTCFSQGYLLLQNSVDVPSVSVEQTLDLLGQMFNAVLTPENGGDSEAGKRLIHAMLDAYLAMSPGTQKL